MLIRELYHWDLEEEIEKVFAKKKEGGGNSSRL
jgi:hypothetical protein